MVKNNNQKVNSVRKRVQKVNEETQGFPTVPVSLANSHGAQRTVDLKFEIWIFSGFTWFATQLTHIHRFMYCGMLSKLTKLSMLSKHSNLNRPDQLNKLSGTTQANQSAQT